VADYRTIVREVEEYGAGLVDKPRITVLNKADALSADELAETTAALKAVAGPVLTMSGVAGAGVTDVLRALRGRIDAGRLRDSKGQEETPASWQP